LWYYWGLLQDGLSCARGLPQISRPQAPEAQITPAPEDELAEPNQLRDISITVTPAADGTAATKGGSAIDGQVAQGVTVKYTGSGFVPRIITVKTGTAVTFVNDAGSGMWVASAPHPAHDLLPGFDQLRSTNKGGTYTYIFAKIGTWKYHNHVAPEITGTVIVTQ
jgi:plastocyanin